MPDGLLRAGAVVLFGRRRLGAGSGTPTGRPCVRECMMEDEKTMTNWKERRAAIWIAGAAIMLLALCMSGCGGGGSSNPRETPNGTLNELERAIRKEDVDAMLKCYTDPFYVIVGGEVTLVSHDIASIAVVHLRRIRSRSCVWPGRGQAGHDARQLTSGGIASATYAFTSCPR